MDYQKRKATAEKFFVNNNAKLEISLLNVQGLTQVKQCEIEKLITENTILCLTETQQKYMNVNVSDD